jgi:hypothetical protein
MQMQKPTTDNRPMWGRDSLIGSALSVVGFALTVSVVGFSLAFSVEPW